MSIGSAAIPLLKAAPEADQLADRLEGGPWSGLELCLLPGHVRDDEALSEAIEVARERLEELDLALTAEAPVSWPSGAHVRVDHLDAEARDGIERSARFAAAVGSPVLTIHLFTPVEPDRYRAGYLPADREIERFLRFYAEACLAHGVKPLIENVPPVLRMRVGGIFLSPIGGHWRDLKGWRERVPELGFTIDVSHAALFRSFAAAYPTAFGLSSADDLELERFVEELGPAAEVAHVSDAHGLLGEGLPYGAGEIELDPLVRRLGELVPFIVAEINEPDSSSSRAMKAGYRAIERALSQRDSRLRTTPRGLPSEDFDWQAVLERRDPIPSLLGLQEILGGRTVLVTGGGGSIGRALASFLSGFRPERIALVDMHEASLSADYRSRDASSLERISHVLCDVREGERLETEFARARPDVVFHLAAYKHVDRAELFPEEFVDTNLHGTWNVLRAAESVGVETVVVASTDKAALAASFYARTKRFMEELTAFVAQRQGSRRLAVRLVNVLGSTGSASELFLEQARAGIPLTVTETGMVRYWITMAHAVTLAAHAALLAGEGARLAAPADPVVLTVGELAERIWTQAGREGGPAVDLVGIRRGETMSEVLTGPGEELGGEPHQGISTIEGEIPTAGAAWVMERLPERATRESARAVWLEAMSRPGLLAPTGTRR
ncbi:MAG TPA: polysaccharide biosynthesis protein [Solirubrobacterales bacterium]|jgi:nucleoside-diphosphate-sugar epimerase|nr:polysaccharide biosynthesis protein [Solirubrobacterales bacterium]